MRSAVERFKQSRKVLAEYTYEPAAVDRGYTGKTLYINLSTGVIEPKEVTQVMKDVFIGGRGFVLWYLWQAVTPQTKWNDPENEIIIASGPSAVLPSIPVPASPWWLPSPLTNCVMDSNVGGHFGPYLKFSGWDALEIQGKAEKDVFVVIDGDTGKVAIEEADLDTNASHLISEILTEVFAHSEADKKNVSVVSAGSAADHTLIGLLNFSFMIRTVK